jgi:ferredoxin, 2Fe-2S
MPRVSFVQPDGTVRTVDAPAGLSVMEAAIDNGVPGIVAECGGACSCATCHVYVDPEWAGRLKAADALESGMLDCALEPRETSRLSCQIALTDELDGLVVHVPEAQI